MTLRIEWVEGRMRLCGELRSEHLGQVKAEIEQRGSTVVLDLEELDLVDVEAVRFNNMRGGGNFRVALLPLHTSVDVP